MTKRPIIVIEETSSAIVYLVSTKPFASHRNTSIPLSLGNLTSVSGEFEFCLSTIQLMMLFAMIWFFFIVVSGFGEKRNDDHDVKPVPWE